MSYTRLSAAIALVANVAMMATAALAGPVPFHWAGHPADIVMPASQQIVAPSTPDAPNQYRSTPSRRPLVVEQPNDEPAPAMIPLPPGIWTGGAGLLTLFTFLGMRKRWMRLR